MPGFQVNIYREVALMQRRFPSFRYRQERGVPTWYGTLQPTEASPRYHIRLTYVRGQAPKVWVINPGIRSHVPHRYSDKSLCLYYPEDKSWTPESGIANTIVLWAAEWLFFYECWLDAGIWWGPFAPHQSTYAKV